MAATGYFVELLANCALWQTLTGSANAAEAATRIITHGTQDYDPNDSGTWPELPFALVAQGDCRRRLIGSPSTYSEEGTLEFRIIFGEPGGATDAANATTIDGYVSGLSAQIEALNGSPGMLDASEYTWDQPYHRPESSHARPTWEIEGEVRYGDEG